MQIFSQLITFTTAPVAISISDANGNPILKASQVFVEPASGSHVSFVEIAGVATGATAATAGVIKMLAAFTAAPTSAANANDSWRLIDHKGGNLIQLDQLQFDGTSGEKVRVSVFVV